MQDVQSLPIAFYNVLDSARYIMLQLKCKTSFTFWKEEYKMKNIELKEINIDIIYCKK